MRIDGIMERGIAKRDLFGHAGRTVFVAGGTSGVNLGIARGFAEAGANVFVVSRDRGRVDDAIAFLDGKGGRTAGAVADVRGVEAVRAAFSRCAETFGEIDVLVSGAAGNFPAQAKDISSNGFRSVLEIDVLGTHHVMTQGWPHLRKPGSSVINVSAPQSLVAMSYQAHVCAAKAGVDMITRTLALEWGPSGIRVNSIVPGPIEDTEGMRRLAPGEGSMDKIAATVPLRRNGTWRDVADLCLFLGSDMASYISGAIIPVDGAWSLESSGSTIERLLAAR